MSKSQLIKGTIAAAALIGAFVLLGRYFFGSTNDPRALATREIVIECSETGETWTMVGGHLMDHLYQRSRPIDPSVGLSSPHAGGEPVAFPRNRDLWQRMCERAEAEMAAVSRARGEEQEP